jgi:uncharacterized protein YndB with AHSA1/START domain
MAKTNPIHEAENLEVVLTRLFDAPRELVFKAWADPKLLAQWWGPHEFTNPVCDMDVRPGGAILIHMQAPDGTVFPMKGVFHEVVVPERLVFTSSALEDEAGVPQLESITTVLFSEQDGQTQVTVQDVVLKATPEAAAALAGMEEGWSQSLERLAGLLK